MARTSKTHPLEIAHVQASSAHGRIGITFCPGKYQPDAATGDWHRVLDLDLDAIRNWGASLVLTLVEQKELEQLRVAGLEQPSLNSTHIHRGRSSSGIPGARSRE